MTHTPDPPQTMNRRRRASAALSLVLTIALLGAGSAAGSASTPRSVQTDVTSGLAISAQTISVRGTVVWPKGFKPAGTNLQVWLEPASSSLDSLVTDVQQDGSFAFTFQEPQPGKYRVFFDAAAASGGSTDLRTGYLGKTGALGLYSDAQIFTFKRGAAETVLTLRPKNGNLRTVAAPALKRSSKKSVLSNYHSQYTSADKVRVTWKGSAKTCKPGSTSKAVVNAQLRAINYARVLAGSRPVPVNASTSVLAQRAALIMDANNNLSHSVPDGWRCKTDEGAQGAVSSNLALGWGWPGAGQPIDLYLADTGQAPGHRTHVLGPTLNSVGIGTTTNAHALQVFDTRSEVTPGTAPFVTWPSAGYFPLELMPDGRTETWSLQLGSTKANYSKRTKVTVTAPNGKKYKTTPVVGWDSMYWHVKWPKSVADKLRPGTYTVRVTGLEGTPSSYTYKVKAVRTPTTTKVTGPALATALAGTAVVKTSVTGYGHAAPAYGTATVHKGRTTLGTIYLDGKGTGSLRVRAKALGLGTHKLTVKFPTTGQFSASSKTLKVKVTRKGAPKITARAKAKLTGTARAGKTLTAKAGGWKTTKVKTGYRWLRNGKAIKSATKRKYTLKAADVGKKISVRVTGTRSGHVKATSTSKATKKVAKAKKA